MKKAKYTRTWYGGYYAKFKNLGKTKIYLKFVLCGEMLKESGQRFLFKSGEQFPPLRQRKGLYFWKGLWRLLELLENSIS